MSNHSRKFGLRSKKNVTTARKKLRENMKKSAEKDVQPQIPPLSPDKNVKAGDKMSNGTVYAGSINGKALCAAPQDGDIVMIYNEAAAYIRKLNRQKYLGRDDWHMPSRAESEVLRQVQNKGAFARTFQNSANDQPDGPEVWYWIDEEADELTAYDQKFSDGTFCKHDKDGLASIRPVCGG